METLPTSTAETTMPTTTTASLSNCSSNEDNSSPCTSKKRIDIFEAEQQSNLVKCDWCERSFNPQRLEIHHRSCTKENPAKRVGAPIKEKWQTKLAEQRNANLQKLNKNENKPSMDNSSKTEMFDIDFKYADEDSYEAELAEFYSYSEMKEWATNLESFLKYTRSHNYPQQFNSLELMFKKRFIGDVLEMLDSAESSVRLKAARLVLYILQGAYGDFCTINEDEKNINELNQQKEICGYEHDCLLNGVINAYFFYQQGLYPALCTMLLHEIQKPFKVYADNSKSRGASMSDSCRSKSYIDNADISSDEHQNKRFATLADNESIRVVLSCIYHMVEAIKSESWIDKVSSKSHYSINELRNLRKQFITELEEPLDDAKVPLIIVLFDMMPSFVRGENPHYPIKKVLLLIWKISLSILGGFEELKEEKTRQRRKHNLPIMEDTNEIGNQMKAIPVSADGEFVDYPGIKNRSSHPHRFISRQLACTPDDGSKESNSKDDDQSVDMGELEDKIIKNDDITNAKTEDSTLPLDNDAIPSKKPKFAGKISSQKFHSCEDFNYKNDATKRSTLPWRSKISESQIEEFLQKAREKFFGFTTPDDLTTTFGLPPSINSSMKVFHRHLYKSLGEIQTANDIKYNRFPFTQKETIPNTPIEKLYVALLPKINDYLVALLKILYAALPNSKSSDGLSIFSDVLTSKTINYEMPSFFNDLNASMDIFRENHDRIELDIARHKEIIVKSISGILLLLLKWLKLNHIYQFEFIVQKFLSLNCVPLLLKFLDQNMIEYIEVKNELPQFNYPTAPIYFIRSGKQWQTLSAENFESSSGSKNYYCWRNIFSSINIVRVLNKITKGKQSRTLMLVVFKSAPILKRCLKVQCGLFQFYCLKLLKLQCRYLGNQWRKANMDLVSTIYMRVRHRINDDWAYAHETRINNNQRDYQNKENDLKLAIEKFHFRRYSKLYSKLDMEETSNNPSKNYFDLTFIDEPVTNCLQSILSSETVFSQRFKRNYEKWLNDEVYGRSVDWDSWLIKTQRISNLFQKEK